MSAYTALPHEIRFLFHESAGGDRSYPHVVPWRRLPAPLVEICSGTWIVELEGEERHRIEPGELLVLPTDALHRISMAPGPNMVSEWTLCSWLWLGVLDMIALCGVPVVLPQQAGRKARPLMRKMKALKRDAGTGNVGAVASLHALGFALFEILMRYAGVDRLTSPDEDMARILPAARYAQEHIAGELSRDALADQAHLSASRFHDVFSRAMGMAPMEYVLRLRIQRARELLLATDKPVYRIAQQCGFNSAPYFNRTFIKRTGMPPGRYRQKVRLK